MGNLNNFFVVLVQLFLIFCHSSQEIAKRFAVSSNIMSVSPVKEIDKSNMVCIETLVGRSKREEKLLTIPINCRPLASPLHNPHLVLLLMLMPFGYSFVLGQK